MLDDTYYRIEEDVLSGRVSCPPVEVPPAVAPCKEVVIEKEDINMADFPLVTKTGT